MQGEGKKAKRTVTLQPLVSNYCTVYARCAVRSEVYREPVLEPTTPVSDVSQPYKLWRSCTTILTRTVCSSSVYRINMVFIHRPLWIRTPTPVTRGFYLLRLTSEGVTVCAVIYHLFRTYALSLLCFLNGALHFSIVFCKAV